MLSICDDWFGTGRERGSFPIPLTLSGPQAQSLGGLEAPPPSIKSNRLPNSVGLCLFPEVWGLATKEIEVLGTLFASVAFFYLCFN